MRSGLVLHSRLPVFWLFTPPSLRSAEFVRGLARFRDGPRQPLTADGGRSQCPVDPTVRTSSLVNYQDLAPEWVHVSRSGAEASGEQMLGGSSDRRSGCNYATVSALHDTYAVSSTGQVHYRTQ